MKLNEELRSLIGELKKPFPAPLHEIRELPGGAKKWVFLRWQTVRERLDEVAPDWTIDHSEIQYLGNDAICRCGITILGIRKEAIASVPIALLSKQGNDMARGSAADRLAAEALKNAAETWGVGRYLDDQPFTIKYLWDNSHKLDDKMMGEVRRLSEQYKLFLKGENVQPKEKESGGLLEAMSNASVRTISEPQQKRLWAIARTELKLSDEATKAAQKHFGFDHTNEITIQKYEAVIEYLHTLVAQPWHSWKTPADALTWAQSQLPAHTPESLEREFNEIPATNGKKAPAWVKRVQELKGF